MVRSPAPPVHKPCIDVSGAFFVIYLMMQRLIFRKSLRKSIIIGNMLESSYSISRLFLLREPVHTLDQRGFSVNTSCQLPAFLVISYERFLSGLLFFSAPLVGLNMAQLEIMKVMLCTRILHLHHLAAFEWESDSLWVVCSRPRFTTTLIKQHQTVLMKQISEDFDWYSVCSKFTFDCCFFISGISKIMQKYFRHFYGF